MRWCLDCYPVVEKKKSKLLLPILLEACSIHPADSIRQLQIVVAHRLTHCRDATVRTDSRQFDGHRLNSSKGKTERSACGVGSRTRGFREQRPFRAALIGTPMVIVYRTSPLTYQIGKRLVTIPYIGLVNILAEKELVPEILQENVTAK